MSVVHWIAGSSNLAQVDADEARDRAEQILTRSEFSEPTPGWVARALERLAGWIDNILGPLFGPIGGGGVEGAVGIVVLVLLAAILVFVVVRLIQRWQPSAKSDEDLRVTSRRESGLSATQWRRKALEHEAAGEWASAVRCHHRATVAELVTTAGLVEPAGSTSGYWRDAAAVRSLGDLEPLTDVFDDIWYGGEPARSEHAKAASRNPLVGGK